MAAEASRGSLARVVEAALHFFGVANVEQLEGLLDDTEQRAMLRNWLRSVHCPRDAAGVVDSDTQTTVVDAPATAAAETREVGSMATFSPSGARLVSVASQAVMRVAQRATQANVVVPVADAAVGAAAKTADAQTQSVVDSVNASTSHYLVLGIGLKEGAAQTTFDVTLLEETLASTLSALDSSQAAQLALQQRVAEPESQHSRLGNGADATTQTEFDVEGLEESLLLSALYPRLEVCRRQLQIAHQGSESSTHAALIVIETQICSNCVPPL